MRILTYSVVTHVNRKGRNAYGLCIEDADRKRTETPPITRSVRQARAWAAFLEAHEVSAAHLHDVTEDFFT